MSDGVTIDLRLEKARALVKQLEAGNEQEADGILDELTQPKGRDLFQEVGRLTRNLHDAIEEFMTDSPIAELAEREIPDASERLSYVITITEESANTTLGAVEASMPLVNELADKANILAGQWKRFRQRELSVDEFRVLSQELNVFLQVARDHSGQLHGRLSEVLLAQGFQDLTGQVIRKVITLIHDVEDQLVQLVRISGSRLPEKKRNNGGLEGPVVPGVDQGDVMTGQDDVDDLLSSLGF